MGSSGEKNRSFLKGAAILGSAGFLIKVLGAAFRIPLTNIIGDDGMGYYQTAYPIYVLFLTLATAGIPTAISRMVAERNAVGRPDEAHRVFRLSFLLLLAIGLSSSSILFFGAERITAFIREPDAVPVMKAIAPALLFVPLMASFRGFFQGRQDMTPTALSQVVEQLFRVVTGLGLAVFFLPKGLQYAAAGASFGATAGGIFGLLGMGLLYGFRRKAILQELAPVKGQPAEASRAILLDLLAIAVPITIGASIMPIINTIDAGLVKIRLVQLGFDSAAARGLYGQLAGMAAPLINFPQVLTQAVAMSLVPVIAAAARRQETALLKKNVELGLRVALVLSIPCAVGMAVLARPIMLLLYPLQRESAASAANCLLVLSLGIVFLALVQTLTAVLQGMGQQRLPVINLAVGACVKLCLTYFLTGLPSIHVLGAALGTLGAYAVAAGLNLAAVCRHTGVRPEPGRTFVRPLLAALVMGFAARLIHQLTVAGLGNAAATLAAVAWGAAIYGGMLLLTRTVTADEVEGLPGGRQVAGWMRAMEERRHG